MALAFPKLSVPELTNTPPENVLALFSVTLPVPFMITPPGPTMGFPAIGVVFGLNC